MGRLQAEWAAIEHELSWLDLRGRRVALFGAGDAAAYPDTFADALGLLAERAERAGASLFGSVSASDYVFSSSRALRGERLVGLALDDGDDEATSLARIDAWCDQLVAALVPG